MNYDEIFDEFNSSYVDKEIRKDIIIDKIFNSDDREIIKRFVNSAFIKYTIKADKTNKEPKINFEEIQILEIDINNYRALYDIYGILLSIIPYPLLAIFRYNDKVSFAVSNRILSEEKNNKGKIYTSYFFINEEAISNYLKIDIDSCKTMIDVYNKWISNIENVVAYYENIERVMQIIEIGLHLKSEEVLEKIEGYIIKYCFTYNMKPKDGWKSKLEKYSDNSAYKLKVETHSLWEYLFENTFLKNRLEYFSDWNDFKDALSYSNSSNDIYYSQYNSRGLDSDDIIDDEIDYEYKNFENNWHSTSYNINKEVEKIQNEPKESEKNEIDDIIQKIIQPFKDRGSITYNELVNQLKDVDVSEEIIDKLFNILEEIGISVSKNEEYDESYNEDIIEKEKQILNEIEEDYTILENADYEIRNNKEFMLQAIKKR